MPGPFPTHLFRIPNGRAGTQSTLQFMRLIVAESKRDPHIRALALDLVRGLKQKDFVGEVHRLYSFVRDRIRYVRDVQGVETLQLPRVTLKIGQGDCDDKATLLASMLESIGHKTRFVAMGFRRGAAFSHVTLEVFLHGRWVNLESTEPVEMGWKPDGLSNLMILHN